MWLPLTHHPMLKKRNQRTWRTGSTLVRSPPTASRSSFSQKTAKKRFLCKLPLFPYPIPKHCWTLDVITIFIYHILKYGFLRLSEWPEIWKAETTEYFGYCYASSSCLDMTWKGHHLPQFLRNYHTTQTYIRKRKGTLHKHWKDNTSDRGHELGHEYRRSWGFSGAAVFKEADYTWFDEPVQSNCWSVQTTKQLWCVGWWVVVAFEWVIPSIPLFGYISGTICHFWVPNKTSFLLFSLHIGKCLFSKPLGESVIVSHVS